METRFNVKKRGIYFEVIYNSGLGNIPSNYNNSIYQINKKLTLKFLDTVRDIEAGLKRVCEEKQNKFDYRLIVLLHFGAIDSIASGLDVRSRLSTDELIQRFYDSYEIRWEKSLKECNEILEFYHNLGRMESYGANYRQYDRYNSFIKEFNFHLKEIREPDFEISLGSLNDKTKSMLYLMKQIRESRGN